MTAASARRPCSTRAVLRSALSQAIREELVHRNVTSIAKPPAPIEPFEGRFLTPEEAKRFLAAADGDRLSALYRVALALALRTRETLALQWSDADFEARTLHVRHTLQRVRRKDRRVQGDGEGLVLQPRRLASRSRSSRCRRCASARWARTARQIEERFAAGTQWAGTDFVLATTTGKPLHAADVLDESFRAICTKVGIPYATRENMRGPVEQRELRLYDLRHSCSSLLIAQGVPLKVIQEILRHSNIRTTSDRYTHLVRQVVGEALAAVDRTLLEAEAT
jgi:integrase